MEGRIEQGAGGGREGGTEESGKGFRWKGKSGIEVGMEEGKEGERNEMIDGGKKGNS